MWCVCAMPITSHIANKKTREESLFIGPRYAAETSAFFPCSKKDVVESQSASPPTSLFPALFYQAFPSPFPLLRFLETAHLQKNDTCTNNSLGRKKRNHFGAPVSTHKCPGMQGKEGQQDEDSERTIHRRCRLDGKEMRPAKQTCNRR